MPKQSKKNTMPKQSKKNTKRCDHCNTMSKSNCQKNCATCGKSFKVGCRMSISNRSLGASGKAFINPKANPHLHRIHSRKPVHARSMMVRAIIKYKLAREELIRLRKQTQTNANKRKQTAPASANHFNV